MTAGTRALVGAAVGLVAFAVTMALTSWQVAALVGWSSTAAVVVGLVLRQIWHRDGAQTAALATREDSSRVAADVLLIAAAVASLVAVGVGLVKASRVKGGGEAAIVGLAVLTVVLSWALVHTVYTLRYAHLFYSGGGGIEFHDDNDPDYRDFAYVALTIGMTFQVSDTDLRTKDMRRTATRHALLSYLFGAVVIAMAINVVAGLLNK
jgi:uncharacterized membrane protein